MNLNKIFSRPLFTLLLFLLISLAVNWPYLFAGYLLDDLLIYHAVKIDPLPYSRWLGVWTSGEYPGFDNIWWKDADVIVRFWRPIPSLIYEGAIHQFDRNALPMHLFSILLHGAVGASLYTLVRKLTGRNGLAILAGLLFVLSEDTGESVGWIATFTDIICVFFILLSYINHIDWLKYRKTKSLLLSLGAMLIAMGCKETASIAPIGIVLLTLFMPDGFDNNNVTFTGLGNRIALTFKSYLSWVPSIILMSAYFVVYLGLDLGGMKNLLYIDPIANPSLYFTHLTVHLPVMLFGTFFVSLLNVTMLDPSYLKPLVIPGIILFAVWMAALWPFRNHGPVWWSIILYFTALLPQLCTDASSRGLYFPHASASVLIAMVIMTIGPLASRTSTAPPTGTRWTRFMGWVGIFTIFLPGIFLSVTGPYTVAPAFRQPEKEFSTSIPYIEQADPDHVIFLNASGMLLSLYSYDYVHYLTEKIYDVSLLTAVDGITTLEKTGERSFIIRSDRPGWLSSFTSRVMRSKAEIQESQQYDRNLFTATIIETTDDNLDALAVRFDFKIPLDDPEIIFLRWDGKAFEPLDITRMKTGDTIELADSSRLW